MSASKQEQPTTEERQPISKRTRAKEPKKTESKKARASTKETKSTRGRKKKTEEAPKAEPPKEEKKEFPTSDVSLQGIGGISSLGASLIEEGTIYFFYRPKVDTYEVKDMADVHNLWVVMQPKLSVAVPSTDADKLPPSEAKEKEKESKKFFRLLNFHRKTLPNYAAEGKDQRLATVERTSPDIVDIELLLLRNNVNNSHENPPSRPIGHGAYAILLHDKGIKDHVHLVFALETPKELGEVQNAFHLPKQGNYILHVKKPETDEVMASVPDAYKDLWSDRTYVSPPTNVLLNCDGVKILFTKTKQSITESKIVAKELEILEEDIEHEEEATPENIFDKLLHLDLDRSLAEPVLTGSWK